MADLVKLEEVKQWMGNTSSNLDSVLAMLINSVSEAITEYCNNNFLSDTYLFHGHGEGQQLLFLPNTPITAVSSLTINSASVPASLKEGDGGYTITENAIALSGGRTYTRGYANVRCSYTAGLAKVPNDVKQACMEMIALRLKEKDRVGISSKSLAGESITFLTKSMPESVREALSNYMRVVPA